MKIGKLLTAAIITGIFSAPVSADGTHGVAVTVINNTGVNIEIQTYNAKDSSRTVPHKVYYSNNNGGTRVVKAHGQGTNKIRILVKHKGTGFTKCDSQERGIVKGDKKFENGSTLTIIDCYSTFDEM